MSEEGAEEVVIEITAIDRKNFRLTGKDRRGTELTFTYKLQTRIRRLTPRESTTTLMQLLMQNPPVFPLEKEHEVLVTWKIHPKSRERVAVKITVL